MNKDKLQNQSIWGFLLRSGYSILVKIWKWLKLLNSVPFIKETLVNHVYIRIWSFWLTFTVLQRMNTNFKISQFSRFLLRSWFGIFVKIGKWLKLLNSFPFIRRTLVNHVYNWVWSFGLAFSVLEWMKTNFTQEIIRQIGRIMSKHKAPDTTRPLHSRMRAKEN